MAALIEAIDVKRKTLFEFEDAPYYCMEAEVNSPTARGGQFAAAASRIAPEASPA